VFPKKIFVLLLSLSCFLSSAVQADTLISMKEGKGRLPDGETFSGNEPRSADEEGMLVQVWSRPGSMTRMNENRRMIFSLDRGVTYLLDDEARTCKAYPHPEAMSADESAAVQTEFNKMGEARQVGPWQAEGYQIDIAIEGMEDHLEVIIWVSSEVTTGLDVYRENFAAMSTKNTAWLSKTMELGGYPVYQESRLGQIYNWAEIVSVSEEPAPQGIYDIPSDYTGCD